MKDLNQQLNPATPLTEEEKALFKWLRTNRENFQTEHKWDAWEVAKLAILNGFPEKMVFEHLSSIIAVQNGQRIDNVIAQQAFLFDAAMENRTAQMKKLEYVREADLSRSWKHYLVYALTGREFRGAL